MTSTDTLFSACVSQLHQPVAGMVLKAIPSEERWMLVVSLDGFQLMVPHAVRINPDTQVTVVVRNIHLQPARVIPMGEVVSDDLRPLVGPSQVATLEAWIDARLDELDAMDANHPDFAEHAVATLNAVDDEFLGFLDRSEAIDVIRRRRDEAERWRQRALARAVDRWVTPGSASAEARFERMVATLARLGFSSMGPFGPITLQDAAFRPTLDHPVQVSFGRGPHPDTMAAGELLHRALFRVGLMAGWDHHPMATIDILGPVEAQS